MQAGEFKTTNLTILTRPTAQFQNWAIAMECSEDEKTVAAVENKHRKEKKELQAQIQAIKKAAKNDKTKKKELTAEIARLERSIEERHQKELDALHNDESKEKITDIIEDENTVEIEVGKLKLSKAQKRRDKKSQLEREREELIKQQAKENLHGPRNQEILDISVKLKKRNLRIFTIPSDGDCLYKAVAHQLLLKRNENFTAEKLRKEVAGYIREHKDEFLPFMTNSDTSEMLNDEEFEVYCDKIVNTTVWGGQLELQSLSNILKCPISVIQATGPDCFEQGTEFEGTPLVITYHRHMYKLGEHYNSTCSNVEGDVET